jgi:hypothetical protein
MEATERLKLITEMPWVFYGYLLYRIGDRAQSVFGLTGVEPCVYDARLVEFYEAGILYLVF